MANLFSNDPGKILDFSGMSSADIFNKSVVPRVNSFDSILDDGSEYEEADRRRNAQLQKDLTSETYASNADDEFLRETYQRPQAQPSFDSEPEIDYNSPVESYGPVSSYGAPAPKGEVPDGFAPTKLKLSNYGYDSDSSPDRNSNVLRLGHANNKLVDGVSAALTKSLAKKHGLKTGDMFEVVTSDGKTLRRRYDDTVPTTYKGKALPETVDLFETKGSNKFGGTIVGIRPIPKS